MEEALSARIGEFASIPAAPQFRLVVNRSVSWAHWDEELLALELEDLKTLDFDLSLTGFDGPEIDLLLLGACDDQQANSTPEPPAHPITIPGNLWLFGPHAHRVLCGDATDPADVSRLLGESRPLLMSTDQPYGVQYEPRWSEASPIGKNAGPSLQTQLPNRSASRSDPISGVNSDSPVNRSDPSSSRAVVRP